MCSAKLFFQYGVSFMANNTQKNSISRSSPRWFKEVSVKSLQDIIDFLDNADPTEITDEDIYKSYAGEKELKGYKLNGTELDALKLIKKYKLQFNATSSGEAYGPSMKTPQMKTNTYSVPLVSMYGHIAYKLNIKGYGVNIIKNTKTKYDNSYASKKVDSLQRDDQYVVLDIETTGLFPLLDDIIQICIYENENNYISRYLPLEKRETNIAYEHNNIKDDLLQNQCPLTQEEIDKAIERFELENKTVVIWTGNNYFDRTFLETYFYQHNLKGLEKIKFYNGKNLLNSIEGYSFESQAKDSIASLYGIDITNAHNALNDCRIEYQIIENLLNKNYDPLINSHLYTELMCKIKNVLLNNDDTATAEKLYKEFCLLLVIKNGKVNNDYDNEPLTRGKEWIDIHHIDENVLDNISTRTNDARDRQDLFELAKLKPYNKKERLVYATKVEHFLLHCLISLINEKVSMGPHLLFGSLMMMEIGGFERDSYEYKIQVRREEFYHNALNFYLIKKIYRRILNMHGVSPRDLKGYYKLESYDYDNDKLESIMQELECEHQL